MTPRARTSGGIFSSPLVVGTATLLIAAVAMYVSYIAENGLPFTPTYTINIDVANAAGIIKNADVRIGGGRVGQVLAITPEPATPAWPHPFARLRLLLDRRLERLPYDTRYQLRQVSALGGRYVELLPGSDHNASSTPALADGGTFTLSRAAGLDHEISAVDLGAALATFGPSTEQGLRSTVSSLGDALAGRGADINDAITALSRLSMPLDGVLSVLAAPSTRLPPLISGAAETAAALAPVAPATASLLGGANTTLGALQRAAPALGAAIDQLPATAAVTGTVLADAGPVLSGVAKLVADVRPGAALIPVAVRRLTAILSSAAPVLGRTSQLSESLLTALAALQRLAADRALAQSLALLDRSDAAPGGASALMRLGALLASIVPAQLSCNVAGIAVRNLASSISEGTASGPWIRAAPVLDLTLGQELLASRPSFNLHDNIYPVETAGQCQAGNEGYTPGQAIGSPPATGATVDNTSPPAGVAARGQAAGLSP